MLLAEEYQSRRPQAAERHFSSKAVENTITNVSAAIRNPELAWLFANCFPNTLDTTVQVGKDEDGRADTYVATGDIHAMWLRDSTNQVWPYLPLAHQDPELLNLLRGVVNRQAKCVLLDPYANAFYKDEHEVSEFKSDKTKMLPGVHERKYELDSLCAVLRLSYGYFDATGDRSCFDHTWQDAIKLILKTIRTEQASFSERKSTYTFQREALAPTDSLCNYGYGSPYRRTGMSRTPFRPSDDATTYQYLVPANAMAVAALRHLAQMLGQLQILPDEADDATKLADEIAAGIAKHGVVEHPKFGKIYAYEVDGYGSTCLMDDGNVPSLLSLPYLGFCSADDPIYKATRAYVLSEENPYYFQGKAGKGVGSPHTGPNRIWPIGIIMQAMTSTDEDEIVHCLQMLIGSHAGKGFMHESFDKDDTSKFTRSWFAWANTLFGELILKLEREKPGVLKKV